MAVSNLVPRQDVLPQDVVSLMYLPWLLTPDRTSPLFLQFPPSTLQFLIRLRLKYICIYVVFSRSWLEARRVLLPVKIHVHNHLIRARNPWAIDVVKMHLVARTRQIRDRYVDIILHEDSPLKLSKNLIPNSYDVTNYNVDAQFYLSQG